MWWTGDDKTAVHLNALLHNTRLCTTGFLIKIIYIILSRMASIRLLKYFTQRKLETFKTLFSSSNSGNDL
jgi:hypothetical protein